LEVFGVVRGGPIGGYWRASFTAVERLHLLHIYRLFILTVTRWQYKIP